MTETNVSKNFAKILKIFNSFFTLKILEIFSSKFHTSISNSNVGYTYVYHSIQAKDEPHKARIFVKQIKNPKKINKREVIAREENKMRNNKNYISKYMQKLKKINSAVDNNGS